ncbi:hypothetical protein STAS_07148 [Striga asiatica]|uniref:Uncharacterized protein n=1 Tax=Striga asiatica TaxID=4170 RepID=A0A5A7PEQ0_STRAF|nr:hypothetical protein STAS_07148 [Striga asiatica]
MGCTASKLDNEDTVQRCKERRRLMKEAVYARHHLAAAHFDYCRALRITGSALATFAAGEPLSVSHHAPAVLLRNPSFTASANPPTFVSRTPASHPPHRPTPAASSVWNWDNFYPPPSPPNSEHFQQLQNKKNPKPQIDFNNSDSEIDDPYSDNDDKASSFTSYSNPHKQTNQYKNPFSSDHGKDPLDDRASNYSSFSRYSDNSYARKGPVVKKGLNLKRWENEETEREEVECSEWGDHDHYSSTSSSSGEEEREDLKSRSDFGGRSDFRSVKNEGSYVKPASVGSFKNGNVNSKFSSKLEKLSSLDDDIDGKSSVSWGDVNDEKANSERRIVVRHKDLVEIVAAIREYFDKAASAGDQVSEMLETGRAQLDRSFKQLRKTVYHSSGMLSNLSSSWTSKPPLAVKYRFEPSSIEQPGGPKSLCSTLERLLAWEKKLYQEVKAREGVKIEHDKKLSSLQSQEYKGEDEAKLDKTKAAIKRLQSLIMVTSQAVSTTSSAIIGLRDSDLVPQLVELCHG